MIFGNPYEFAVLIEYVPEWSTETFRYGLFHFMLDGKMFPDELVTSTLDVDLRDFLGYSALVSPPENCEIFKMSKEEAFNLMFYQKAVRNFPEEIYNVNMYSFIFSEFFSFHSNRRNYLICVILGS